MGFFRSLFRPQPPSASIAKERLKIVLAHERASSRAPDFLPILQKELLAVVGRYVEISDEMIRVTLGGAGDTSTLEINIEIEGGKLKKGGPSGPALSAAV
jgi:cell division topological specificity factor